MLFRRRSANRELTAGSYELTTGRGYTRLVLLALGVIVLAVLAGGGLRYSLEHFAPKSQLSVLEQENSELRSELDKARFEFEVERATRSELERQLASLTEKLRQTEEELAFMKAATAQQLVR